jgi:hypothetical protein
MRDLAPRGALQVTRQDRGSLAEIHLLQVDQLAGTVGLADSGPGGDRVHADRCQSLFQEEFCRGLQDRVVRFFVVWPPALPCRGCRVAAHESLAPRPAAASDRTELTPTQGAGAGAEQSSAILECQRMHASMRLIGGSWRSSCCSSARVTTVRSCSPRP